MIDTSYLNFIYNMMIKKIDDDLSHYYDLLEECSGKEIRQTIEKDKYSDWRTSESIYGQLATMISLQPHKSEELSEILRKEAIKKNIGHLNELRNEIKKYFEFKINGKEKGTTNSFLFDRLDYLLQKEWDPACYQEIKWNDNKRILNELRTTAVIGLGIGDPETTAEEIAKNTGEDKRKCKIYIRTINAEIQSLANINNYKRFKVKKYQIIIAYDIRTCDKCQQMDMKIFNLDEARIGNNFPPFHPGCRCATVPYREPEEIDLPESTKIARDKKWRNIYIPESMTYKEWKQKFINNTEQNNNP